MKMSLICGTHFHMNSFARTEIRFQDTEAKATRKFPIAKCTKQKKLSV